MVKIIQNTLIHGDLVNNEDGTYSVNLNLSQIKNSNPKFFIMPIDIKIYYQNGDSTFTVFNNLNIQEFSFLLNSRPHNLEFDPNNKILKEIISFSTSVKNEYFINEFKLGQNYPNPFNPVTKINYSVPQGINYELSSQNVILKVYDVLGREITTLVNEAKQPGNYEVIFNATNLSTGIYYYKILSSGNFAETKKMVVLK